VYYRAALAQGRDDQEAACVHAVLKNMGGSALITVDVHNHFITR
jgi:hypothetical protein